MLKSRSTASTSDSQSYQQLRARNKEANEKRRKALPIVVGIGRHISVERVDRCKWRLGMFVQIKGEPSPRYIYLGTSLDYAYEGWSTRDEARNYLDLLHFQLAKQTTDAIEGFFHGGGLYPDAEIRNNWVKVSFKGSDFERAFKVPRRFGMVGINI